MQRDVSLEVVGAKELAKVIRNTRDKELKKALRLANKKVGQVVVDGAKRDVPVVSGKLLRSLKSVPTLSSASVRAGTPGRVPYASVIHWGYKRRSIAPNPFLYKAMGREWENVMKAYEKQILEVMNAIDTKP